jgi:hypothetical protein
MAILSAARKAASKLKNPGRFPMVRRGIHSCFWQSRCPGCKRAVNRGSSELGTMPIIVQEAEAGAPCVRFPLPLAREDNAIIGNDNRNARVA